MIKIVAALRSRTRSRSGRRTCSSRTTAGSRSPILVAATALRSTSVYLVPRQLDAAGEVPDPRNGLPDRRSRSIPILYTINVAFSNYSTGHILTKGQAIEAIKVNSLQPPANGRQFDMAPARDSSGKLVLILHDDDGGKPSTTGTNRA